MAEKANKNQISTLKCLDYLFVPSSFIRLKKDFERQVGKIDNLMYLPMAVAEVTRLYCYYDAATRIINMFK